MRQPRILSRSETLLRDPATGASNLAGAAGTWFELRPRRRDERFDVSMLGMAITGPDLLKNLDRFGGAAGSIEIAVEVDDEYGAVRDMAALTPETVSTGAEWNRGTHSGTIADREAGAQRDGSNRVGLRGTPAPLGVNPGPAQWTSATQDFLYASEVAAVSWECWRLLDAAASTVAPPAIELQAGTRGPGGVVNWNAPITVASTAGEIEQGYADLAAPLQGDVYRWRITLPYVDAGVAVQAGETVLRTATFFSLCAWLRLAAPRWIFGSLADLIERSEMSRHIGAGASNAGSDDLILLRVPLSIHLHGKFDERLRARLNGGALRVLEIYPAVDLRFEEP